MGDLADKYLNKILSQGLLDNTPTDPPGSLEGLNANDFTAVIYNEIVSIIKELEASGEIKEGEHLDAAGITAQILLESNNGKSSLAAKYNNFGGIKDSPNWKGETVLIPNSDGDVYWRVYPSVKEGLREQVKFFLPSKNSRYSKAGVLKTMNAEEWARKVQEAGYAGEQKDYADRVIRVAKEIPTRLKRANPKYSKGLEYEFTSVERPDYQEEKETNEPVNKPITIGKTNPAQIFLNEDTKIDLNTPIDISSPGTKIYDNSFYNDPRNEQQLKQSLKNKEILNAPIKFKQGGTMNFKSNAAYKKWLAYGHASGEFAKTPGNQKVSIKGKPKKVQHRNGGNMYPRYFNNGGPKEGPVAQENIIPFYPTSDGKYPQVNQEMLNKLQEKAYWDNFDWQKDVNFNTNDNIDNYMNPVMFNIDPKTENIKVYDPETGTYKVTDRKFDFSDKGAIGYPMSHRTDIYEANDQSPEALAAREEKALMQLELAKEQASRGMEQIGKRASMSAKNLESLEEQGVAQSYRDWLGHGFQCISGTSACFAPNPNAPDEVSQNLVTMPYYSSKGFALNKPKSNIGTRKTGQGTTSPGDPIPTISGNESFASWYPSLYGFQMLPPQSPVRSGQVHVLHGYEKNNGYSNDFQYGKGSGSYHAQLVADEENGLFNITNNPVAGPFRHAYYLEKNQPIDRGTAQFDYVGDTRYYQKVLEDIKSKKNIAKND